MSTKARLYRAVVQLLDADARGRDELLKKFWENCTTGDEATEGKHLLRALLGELARRAENADRAAAGPHCSDSKTCRRNPEGKPPELDDCTQESGCIDESP